MKQQLDISKISSKLKDIIISHLFETTEKAINTISEEFNIEKENIIIEHVNNSNMVNIRIKMDESISNVDMQVLIQGETLIVD